MKKSHEELTLRIDQMIAADSLDIEITPESLASYVDHNGADGQFSEFIDDLGWSLVAYCHGNRMEDYSDLRAICELVKIETISEFDSVMKELDEVGESYLKMLSTASPGPWSVSPLFLLQLLILVHRGSHVDLETMLKCANWSQETASIVLGVARSLGPNPHAQNRRRLLGY